MAITYKSVIAQAIGDFNDIQTALSTLGATYKFDGTKVEAIPAVTSDSKLVPTADFDTIISEQLQVKASGNLTITGAGSFDVKKYATVSVAAGSYSPSHTLTAGSTTVNSVGEGNDFFSDTATKYGISAYGTVSGTGTATIGTSGWITAGSKTSTVSSKNSTTATKYLKAGSYSLSGGGLTTSGSLSVGVSKATDANSLNATLLGDKLSAASGHYIKIDATGSGTFTVTKAVVSSSITEGYIKSGITGTPGISGDSKSVSAPSSSVYIAVKDAVVSGGGSGSFTPEISANVSATATGATNLATALTKTVPTSGFFAKISSASQSAKTFTPSVTTAGYIGVGNLSSSSASLNASDDYYLNIPAATGGGLTGGGDITPAVTISPSNTSGLCEVKNSVSEGDIYIKISATSGTGSKTITRAAIGKGYTTGIASATQTVNVKAGTATPQYLVLNKGSLSNTATKDVEYTTITEPIISITDKFLYINKGWFNTNQKISLGTLIPQIDPDATSNHILNGYKAFDENGNVLTGTIPIGSNMTGQNPTLSGLTVSYTKTITKGYYDGTKTISGSLTLSTIDIPVDKALTVNTTADTALDATSNLTITNNAFRQIALTNKKNADTNITNSGRVDITNSTASGETNTGIVTYTNGSATKTIVSAGALVIANPSFSGGGINGNVTITNNTTSPTKSGENAIINDTETTYVLVNATGSASRGAVKYSSAVNGWVEKASGSDALSAGSSAISGDTARVPAVIPGTVTNGTPSATIAAITVGSATTFDGTTGAKTAGSKTSGTKTATIDAVTTLSNQYKDKYIIGGLTTKTNSGTATFNGATIANDATGSTVDSYVESLYKRMLGQSYTAVSADA